MGRHDCSQPSPLERAKHYTFVLAVFLLTLVVVPLALPLMLVFRIYRNITKSRIHELEGDRAIVASGDDSMWLQDSPENRAIINALVQFKGVLDLEKFRQALSERLVNARDPQDPSKKLYPKITRYATKMLHRYVWYEDPSFDVRRHIYVHPVPAPTTKADLERLVGEVYSTPLPLHQPGWQFVFLLPPEDDPEFGKSYHAVFRVHHAIADGISLVRIMMQAFVDEQPKARTGSARYSSKNLIGMATRAVFEGPSMLVDRLFQTANRNVFHGPELSGNKIVSWSDPIDLSLFKDIKNATDTTVNDVVISCLATTLRDYCTRHAAEVPSNVMTYIPVDIRPASRRVTMDNQFAIVFLNLPLNLENQLQTLRETKKRMDSIKRSPEPIVNAYTMKYFMNRLPSWMTQIFFDFASAKSTMIVSNVPGPDDALSIAGHEISALVFWPPQRTNVGMGISVFSYCGTIRVGVSVDSSILSNPRRLVEGFMDSVHRLADTVKRGT